MDDRDLYWLAGLLEGEGCFDIHRYRKRGGAKTPRIRLKMTDEDVVRRVSCLFDRSMSTSKNGRYKMEYFTQIQGKPAVELMMKMFSHLGSRRQSKIIEILMETCA